MKKLIILLALIATFSFMFAVESEPSDVVGFVKYECITTGTTNLNYVAVSLEAGITTAQDYANDVGDAGVVNQVSRWDAINQGWETVTYSQLPFPPFNWVWSDDFDVLNGDVLVINVTENVDYYCAGDIASDPIYNFITTVTTNLNTLMLPLGKSAIGDAQALANDIGDAGVVNQVSCWDASLQGWETITYSQLPFPPYNWVWSDNFNVDIGAGYMVNLTENATWPTVNRANSNKKEINNK